MAQKQHRKLRIIGGQWRSRQLSFADIDGLRPTADRVRETLFNWLAPYIPGARCLDLFAGSGALSFEALSRGASHVTLIEKARPAYQALKSNLNTLEAKGANLIQADALAWLGHSLKDTSSNDTKASQGFDIIFLDPPFKEALLQPCFDLLHSQQGWLKPKALVYLELPTEQIPPALPTGWQVFKQSKMGQVKYYLYLSP